MEVLAVSKWIAVEDTKPKTETPVLAVVFVRERLDVIRAYYIPSRTVECGGMDVDNNDEWFDYEDDTDMYWIPEGWYECNHYEDTHWFVQDEVTHWMPLPEPPRGDTP